MRRKIFLSTLCVLAITGCAESHGVSHVIAGSEVACRFNGATDAMHIVLGFPEGTLMMTWEPGTPVGTSYFGPSRSDEELISAYRSRMQVEGRPVSPSAEIRVVDEDGSGAGVLEVIGEVEVETASGGRLLRFESREVRLFASCGG